MVNLCRWQLLGNPANLATISLRSLISPVLCWTVTSKLGRNKQCFAWLTPLSAATLGYSQLFINTQTYIHLLCGTSLAFNLAKSSILSPLLNIALECLLLPATTPVLLIILPTTSSVHDTFIDLVWYIHVWYCILACCFWRGTERLRISCWYLDEPSPRSVLSKILMLATKLSFIYHHQDLYFSYSSSPITVCW